MKKTLVLFLLLSACTLAPTYERPNVDAPAWREGSTEQSELPADWWRKFESPELNQLIDQSLQTNTDLAAAVQRVEEARAQARIASAALYPSVEASGNLSNTTVDHTKNDGTTKAYRAGVSVAYEVDLFGKNLANSEAAHERVRGSQFDHDALQLVVTSDTANAYAQLLSTEDRLAVAQKNLENTNSVMKIIQARFDAGSTSGLELAQQKTTLANTQANISSLEQQLDALRDQLAVLTGQPPQNFNVTTKTLDNFIMPTIAAGQPSDLLERRPDIKTAESNLKAANIDIGAARAAYFPSFNIGLSSFLGATPSSAPASLTTGLIGSALAPIFEGGAIDANVDQTKARKQELIATYRGVVLNAFKEVEDALSASKSATARTLDLQTAAVQAQKAFDIAAIRYKEGSADYQSLLDTQRALFQAQDSFYQARFDQVSSAVNLYKALGGGWKDGSQ